jgi:hypothetical protein
VLDTGSAREVLGPLETPTQEHFDDHQDWRIKEPMTFDRAVGITGTIIGIPGFVLLFLQGQQVAAALCVLLAAVIFIGFVLHRKATDAPPFKLKSAKVLLTIHDAAGALGKIEKHYTFVPCFANMNQMTHRNIASDGTVSAISWNGQPVPATGIKEVLGEYQVTIDFRAPLTRGVAQDGILSYEIADSFPNADEALVYVVDFPTPLVEITVRLPQNRLAQSAKAFQVRGAGRSPVPSVELNASRDTVTLRLKKPPMGAEYEIWWNW